MGGELGIQVVSGHFHFSVNSGGKALFSQAYILGEVSSSVVWALVWWVQFIWTHLERYDNL